MLKRMVKLILSLTLATWMALLPAGVLAIDIDQEFLAPSLGGIQEGDTLLEPDTVPDEPVNGEEVDKIRPDNFSPSEDVSSFPELYDPGNPAEDKDNGRLHPDMEETVTEEELEPITYTSALGSLRTGDHDAYMVGYQDGNFRPNQAMTRAEVATMFYNLLTDPVETEENPFTDLEEGSDYYQAALALNMMGIITGYSDKTFRPNGSISRAEFVKILGRCFQQETADINYSDVPNDFWAYAEIASAQAKGWIGGYSDGTFRPNESVTRAQVAKVMNIALERRDSDFAKDKDKLEFRDVSKNFWAFEDIAEAADPHPDAPSVVAPSDTLPSGIKVGSTVRVNAETGLNIRKAPINGQVITAVANGTLLTVTDITQNPWLGVRTSSGITGYSSADYLELYTAPPGPSQNGSLSAPSLTLHQYQSARLDAAATTDIKSMKWTSSNDNVAYVSYTIDKNGKEQAAIVYANAPGTAILSFADASGAVKDKCTITVTEPEAVRAAYAEGNVISVGADFDLIAITDDSRDKVRFDIVDGPASGNYTTTSYQRESADPEGGNLPVNDTRLFRRTVSFGAVGVYTIRAYSAKGDAFSSDFYTFTVQVSQASSKTATTNESRRASGEIINLIAAFEGYVQLIELDQLPTSFNPTVGNGYVVQKNEVFYNNMTKNEAYAFLCNTVNTKEYVRSVENFRSQHNIKMSQAQFDALVSFVYNCGPNALNVNSYDTPNIILNMIVPPSDVSAAKPYSGVLNVVATRMYADANYKSTELVTIPQGTSISVIDIKVNRSSTKQEVWYKTSYNGKTGWVASGYVKLMGSFTRDLGYADTTSLANELLQWHKSGGNCTPGLVYRRLAECKMFFFGNYADAINGSANYRKNTYGFRYPPCCAYLGEM